MSFQLNSDREQLRGVDPTIIGSGSVRIRAGAGDGEREIFQAKIDATSNLPRVGINRTGRRIDSIKVLTQGLGYTSNPSVNISAPTLVGGVQAIASATTDSFGRITGIGIDNPGDGYALPPTVTITGGGGSGATAEAFLDTIDFELDVNGAIRTSTSIISDTANILNLDINNLVTPDIKVRAPDLKTFGNGIGVRWPTQTQVNKDSYYFEGQNIYQALNSGVTGLLPPFHDDGTELNGEVQAKHIGFRIDASSSPFFGEGGDAGIFPRSITPLLGDKSDKIATTEYVLNLATNDVGGRIYVSEQIGDNANDGRSPVNPVRTIKKACQLAWETPGVKESIIIAGGEYLEDNPISIPPDASIVGDNLRLVIIRPQNDNKHIFKFGDKNYVIGVTYQDRVNASGGSVGTWDFAMVFDDKQRLSYDANANGDFGTNFPIGHQFFGNESFTALFDFNLVGLDNLVAGIEIFGVNSNATGIVGEVVFDISDPTSTDEDGNPNAFQTGRLNNIVRTAGESFNNAETFFYGGAGTTKWQPSTDYALGDLVWTDAVLGDQSLTAYVYEVTTAGTSGTSAPTHNQGVDTNGTVGLTYVRNAYSFNARELTSTRPEGEVVFEGEDPFSTDVTELPVAFIDFSLQGTFTDGFQHEIYGSSEDLGGVVFYTNQLDGALNIHDFKEGDEVLISGMPSAPNDLSFLNGKQRIYKVIEDADGRSRRFVIPKKIPSSYGLNSVSDWNPADVGAVVSVQTYTKSVTLSLLNSPNKFPLAQPLARRYQDASLQIRNNIEFIADEVVGRINDEFKQEYFFPYDIGQGGGNDFKIYLGTSRFAHTWVSGGTVTAGGNTYNVTGFDYDYDTTGEATITVDSPIAFNEDDTILLADLTVSCLIDGVVTQKTYPSFNIPVSDQKCRRDIGHFLNALIQDLEFGSNYNIINAAKKYVDAGQIEYVDYEIIQTVRAIEYARELAIYAMRKWRTGDGSPGQTVYVPQYSTLDQYIDPTVIDDLATPACANVASAINTLSYLFVDVLANDASGTYLDAAYLISRNRNHIADEAYKNTVSQYPSLTLGNIDERKCRRDINYILSGVLRDLVLGGNTGSVNAAESYYSGSQLVGVPQSELGATRHAFRKVRDLSIQAMRNWKTASGNTVTPNYTIIPQFTDGTILVDADGTPTAQLTPTAATYNPGTGDFTMTFASAHGVTTNESIRLEIESFVFTCSMDNYRTEHYLPESDQPAATQLLPITSVTTNTITVNVGSSGPDVTFTPTDATYDPATGDFVITMAGHGLSTGEGIVLGDNSFTFTCAMDGYDAQKTYPRPGIDPFAGRSLKIKSATEDTITVNVGASGPNKYFTPTAATYDPTTGDMTVTVGQHGLGVGRGVVLEDNSFTFTCLTDPNDPKTYPRPGQDPFAGKSIAITSVGNTTHTPSSAAYDPAAGTLTITLNSHGFSQGDYIKIDDNAITFTCDLDGNATQHTYPRSYEYASGRWFAIDVVDTNTIRISGLPIPRDQSTHTFVSFAPNALQRQDGTFTINVGSSSDTSAHTFVSATANAIKHEPQTTHTFVSATTGAVQHLPQSNHVFQRVTGTNVVAAYPSGGSAPCADVEATLTTSFALIDGILEYAEDNTSPTAIQPGLTTRTTGTLFSTGSIINYPDNVLRDANGNTVTIRGIYDDLPIISASPYTQNSSIISKIGGSGALIDGSKVKQPNCPFPGLTDGKATFPNQGKSMVASAFTIVSEKNGIGYKVIEDGYTQLVSVFCIFTVDGILCETGGYASVTNSASNFGIRSLKATGYRREPYTFDAGYDSTNSGYQRARIDGVILAESGQTQLTVDNLGRAPLEDYIIKIDGHETLDPDLEYTITKVKILRDGPPFRAEIEVSDGQGAGAIKQKNSTTGLEVTPASLDTLNISLHRPSIVNSSSHTFEFVGSGTDYDALPENGGIKIGANEMVSEDYGRVYASGTDELGDFKVGDFVIIENRTGNIQFKGTVSISEVDFLKLSGSGVTITGFSDLATLGGDDADDKTLPTQKAVRDFIINNLGQYIGKGFTTNQVPRALVELTDTGLISESQLPSTSPIEVYSVDDEQAQLQLEGVRAGDIAVVDGEAFILNTDNDSLFLGINVDTSLQFTVNDIFTGTGADGTGGSGGKIQLTEYRPGVVKRIFIPDGGGGSGYSTSNPPTVVITDTGTSVGHVAASAVATVAGGQVVAIDLVEANGYKGGIGYNSVPTISFTNTSGGSGATATAEIESRLYGDIVNSIKIVNTDFIRSSDVPAETVDVIRVVNTSASDLNNWVALGQGAISADQIVNGPIPTNILSDNSAEANSNSFLAGDSSYKKVVKSIRKIEQRYFLTTATDSTTDTILFEVTGSNPTANLVVGHGLVATTGIQAGTTVDQITAVQVGTDNFVRITLSDGLLSTVPAGTIIEFTRPEAPIVVSSLLSTPGAIDQILIEDGGSGFNDGDPGTRVFNNITVGGGTQGTGGKDALMDITVTAGVVTLVNVVDAGAAFNGDFLVTTPSEIGTAGSGLILRAKVATEAKQEGDVTVDVKRATADTLNADEFGTVGVVRLKKSQFTIGSNGSVQINTGRDSGLDADLLDGNQSDYYRNASNINSGVLNAAYLSGTYTISITGESGNTKTLTSEVGSINNDLPPGDIRAGATVAVRQNDDNQLLDPPTKPNPDPTGPKFISTASDYNTVLSIRGGGTGTTNQYGGVHQIGFTDGNNAYLRGSSGSVDSEQDWSTWGKIWTSQNDYSEDPANTSELAGPNAYRLRNRTGLWYQGANTLTFGNLRDRRLPSYQTTKDFNNRVRLLTGVGNGINYDIYISEVTAGVIAKLDAAPFTSNPPIVKLLTVSGDDPGQIRINNIAVYDIDGNEVDTTQTISDYSSLHAIVTGTLETGGNFTFTDANGDEFPVVKIGDDTSEIDIEDYAISSYDGNADGMPDGNVELARLESDSGTPRLILGREDGLQGSNTNPTIWFRSSATIPLDGGQPNTGNWYNSGFEATGGNDNNGSGTLNVLVTNPNSFTVGSNIIWNAGNTLITATNTGSTYTTTGGVSNFEAATPDLNVEIRSLVMRDEDGNFAANIITADLDGTATGNLPIDGGTLSGGLQIGNTNNDASLVVYGPTTLNGNLSVVDSGRIVVGDNAFIADPTDGIGIGTTPDYKLDLYQRTNTSGSATGTTLFRLTNDVRNFADPAAGDLNQQKTFIDFTFTDDDNNATPQVRIGAEVGENADANTTTKEGSGAFVVYTSTGTSATAGTLAEKFRVDYRGYVGILTTEPSQPLHVEGNAYINSALTANESILIGNNTNNNGAPLYFNGSTTAADGTTRGEDAAGNLVTGYNSNFRIGNSIIDDDIFEITATDGDAIAGGASKYTFKNVPAISVEGSSNRVGINTTSFGGTDPNETDGDGNNIVRDYQFNIEGDVNFNGTLFQNNSEFVTSRWTESPNGNNIYRPSFVGINFVQTGSKEPGYPLEVFGGTNILGSSFTNQVNTHTLHANGDKQWLDSYGIMKANRNTIEEDITIPQNTNCMSAGPIEIASGTTITIQEGASWSVV
ncbi:structural protein [Synechococcus phage S-H9-2]|uniref:Structural protein n=1 Tax=Synechococcus phage S-H9-2 TaxID=2783669 RepID=A0A873WFX4_9CAUD|nr:baseplate wedge subunit [Synechococcus phage S-H9-2]QPB08296.1 structural protein [Synechococcus phage S-H9-2]